MKFLALVAVLVLVGGVAEAQCVGRNCPQVVVQGCVGGNCGSVVVAPPVIYQPRVTYQPYQLKSSTYTPKVYRTTVRNLFFGRGRWSHTYAPVEPQVK